MSARPHQAILGHVIATGSPGGGSHGEPSSLRYATTPNPPVAIDYTRLDAPHGYARLHCTICQTDFDFRPIAPEVIAQNARHGRRVVRPKFILAGLGSLGIAVLIMVVSIQAGASSFMSVLASTGTLMFGVLGVILFFIAAAAGTVATYTLRPVSALPPHTSAGSRSHDVRLSY